MGIDIIVQKGKLADDTVWKEEEAAGDRRGKTLSVGLGDLNAEPSPPI